MKLYIDSSIYIRLPCSGSLKYDLRRRFPSIHTNAKLSNRIISQQTMLVMLSVVTSCCQTAGVWVSRFCLCFCCRVWAAVLQLVVCSLLLFVRAADAVSTRAEVGWSFVRLRSLCL